MKRAVPVATAALLAVGLATLLTRTADAGPDEVLLTAVSTDAALVTGGDVLLQAVVPDGMPRGDLHVSVNGRDVTAAFQPAARPDTYLGVVSDLAEGDNRVVAEAGPLTSTLTVTNYPITGPVISGPWQQPFICQTDQFVLPDGSTLGPALDANCSARTVVQYVYRPTHVADAAKPFRPLPNPAILPADVSQTKTASGAVVNFIVRVETGTMNRGIYQNAVLHDPTVDAPPTPTTPPRGWNRRLIAIHGSGCPSGWYIQGGAMGVNVLDYGRLAEGYGLFINTLNHPTNSCNAFLAGETTMMGKEHFIETFGVPAYTISTGGSGGAYTSLQVADAFPGLIDGVDIRATFPDALSIALSGLDAHLLLHYFAQGGKGSLTEAQQVAISGFAGMKAFVDAANQAQRTDPVPNRKDADGYQSARWNAAVPRAVRYDPATNRTGVRPTVFDAARNIYGVNPATGAALRPYDNVGVQYGLHALNAGTITVDQFLDLNERIGGYDEDANYTATRTSGDADAIRRAYQAGLSLGANGGLTTIPIFDNATSNEAGGYHYGWFHYALRERLRKASGGRSDNMAMWRSVNATDARATFDAWMVAYTSDRSDTPQLQKVVSARPAQAVEGCYDTGTPAAFIAEPLAFTRTPSTRCTALYPVYSNVRVEAGGPLSADVLKCQLAPVNAVAYRVPFTPAQSERLARIFPEGVCDWSRPGVNQVPVVPWASFGPSPRHRIN